MTKTWYPIIDYMECIECGTCTEKCSHGVYDEGKAPTPVVVKPEFCIDHCHGCGSLCAQGAITYLGEDTGWIPPNSKVSKQAESCCYTEQGVKQLIVDFLYLDLTTCERCQAADSALDEAVADLSGVLKTLGYKIIVNKVNITSAGMAKKYHFLSSPTIRVNGWDICTEVKENDCQDCGDLCGSDVDCRVFVYQGVEYEQPPQAMIMDGILKAIYSSLEEPIDDSYTLPKNLEEFFAGRETSCCDGECEV